MAEYSCLSPRLLVPGSKFISATSRGPDRHGFFMPNSPSPAPAPPPPPLWGSDRSTVEFCDRAAGFADKNVLLILTGLKGTHLPKAFPQSSGNTRPSPRVSQPLISSREPGFPAICVWSHKQRWAPTFALRGCCMLWALAYINS